MAETAEHIELRSQVSVAAGNSRQVKRARQLAQDLGLEFTELESAPLGYVLYVSERALELHSSDQPPAHGPIYVDFVGGKSAHRRLYGGGRNQHLARAVGLKSGYTPAVIDATAGLGQDAFVLATLGCNLRMIESCQPVAQLLEDGLLRARADEDTSVIAQRMRLYNGDALDLLPTLARRQRPDVVYLDPMYPPREKSAAVKKEMQMLQVLTDAPSDGATLLELALKCADRRVVVKRPVHAGPLGDKPPQACVNSPKTRYDIYIPASR